MANRWLLRRSQFENHNLKKFEHHEKVILSQNLKGYDNMVRLDKL